MEDKVVKSLLDTKLWKHSPSRQTLKSNEFRLYSDMKGYSDGRYRIELIKLKRKVLGKIYKISICWTPYNPDNMVYSGRVNNYEELVEVIKGVNKELLETKRAYS